MSSSSAPANFNSSSRKNLFLELASRGEGTTPAEVYEHARRRGDDVTEEAYYNIGRRLAHRGLLRVDGTGSTTRYFAGPVDVGHWLDEDDLYDLIDPDYPLLALTVANESAREMRSVPEETWIALRDQLRSQPARQLFAAAIEGYAQDYADQIQMLIILEERSTPEEYARLRREAEVTHRLLLRFTKFGLGLSKEAVPLPLSVDASISAVRSGKPVLRIDAELLKEELERRISDEAFIADAIPQPRRRALLIGAVDGSTRGGVLSFLGEEGDFVSGHAPMVSINTAVGQVNRDQQIGSRLIPTFLRLPERPEDMQREDNRFTVMAKMLFPDMSDGKYMHAVWNAMDLIEGRAALRLLGAWAAPQTHIEVPAADVVFKDGAISPQDRDFSHYSAHDTYGRIVREAIKVNWEIAKHCKEDGQTVGGVVKTAQLSVFAPVINWLACKLAAGGSKALAAWPLTAMNLLPDQTLLTHLLTAGRRKGDTWTRTCLTVRPFHALTNFGEFYRRVGPPSAVIAGKHEQAMRDAEAGVLSPESAYFWIELFRAEHDPYVQMMDHVSYASFFLGCVPRLDAEKQLPRFEFIVNESNHDAHERDWSVIDVHREQIVTAVDQNGIDVAAEHNMFESRAKLDILPSILIQVHDTVKHWSADLLSRVQEYVGYYVARYVQSKRIRKISIRPFNRAEYELLYTSLKKERDALAGEKRSEEDDEPRLLVR